MRKRRNDFSLKKAFKDVANIAIAPAKLAVSSITGKDPKLEYSTKLGKAIGGVHDAGSKALTSTVKGFADTVTGGYATKAANLVRSDENKETPYGYNEMKGTNVGIKAIDKSSKVLSKVGATVGGIAGAGALGSGISGMIKKGADVATTERRSPPAGYPDTEDYIYKGGGVPGDGGKNPADQIVDDVINGGDKGNLLDDMVTGNETVDEQPNFKLGGSGDLLSGNNLLIIGAIILLIILMMAKK